MPALTKKSWLLKSAVAAVPLLIATATASAQYRINENDGRALDANNRLGSGGHNTAKDLRVGTPTGNDIVTGNVTGMRHFRGRVDYTDPRAFRGSAPSASAALRATAGLPELSPRTSGARAPASRHNPAE